MKTSPTARPISSITGEVMDKVEGSAAWEDDLGGVDIETVKDTNLDGVPARDLLPIRADLHVLPAAPVQPLPQSRLRGKLPVGLHIQARGRRHRLGRPEQVPRLAHVHDRLPRTRRSTTTGRAARPRSASSAIPASRAAVRPYAPRRARVASAISESSSTMPIRSRPLRASKTTRTSTRRSEASSSTRSTSTSSREPERPAYRTSG